jgi:ATP-dependent Clp protease adaptor protein ClpS
MNETIVEPKVEKSPRAKKQPRYNVLLHNDDDHTYHYVINMMTKLFSKSTEEAYKIAENVDKNGLAICLTTTKEHAELKRDQIHGFGVDPLVFDCSGSMTSTIEPIN